MFVPRCMVPGAGIGGYVNLNSPDEVAELPDVTTLKDEFRQHAHDEPEHEVRDGTVTIGSVHLGRLEIRPLECMAGYPSWACEVLLDGVPVQKVTGFTLSCHVGEVPRLILDTIV